MNKYRIHADGQIKVWLESIPDEDGGAVLLRAEDTDGESWVLCRLLPRGVLELAAGVDSADFETTDAGYLVVTEEE